MQVTLGVDDYAYRQKSQHTPVLWDSQQTVNGHILLVGKSGTGKTFTLKKFVDKAGESGIRYHIFDVHGDIDIPGASTVLFSEATEYGLSPLRIDPDPHFGGVRKRIQSFISTINRTNSRVLGPKQEAVLRNILIDLYAANGFHQDKPETWRLDDGIQRRFPKKHPNIDDAHRFAYGKLKQMFLGADTKAVKFLDEVNRKSSALQFKARRLNNTRDDEIEKLETEIETAKNATMEAFSEYLGQISTGHELDGILKYDSADVMKSVADRLENMRATGIFRNQAPPFHEKTPVWRYDIRALSEEEKRMFVEFRLQEVFQNAARRGACPDIREIIILDEAHMFFKDDEDNILNTIAKEARKFGVALLCASQSPTHFSDDFVANVATKIILGIDQMYWDGTIRKMRIDGKMLDYLVPRKTIAVQVNNRSDSKAAFRQVYVG